MADMVFRHNQVPPGIVLTLHCIQAILLVKLPQLSLLATTATRLTIAVKIAPCERTFSSLKCIKSYLRSSMSEQRLTDIAILSIERNRADSLILDEMSLLK